MSYYIYVPTITAHFIGAHTLMALVLLLAIEPIARGHKLDTAPIPGGRKYPFPHRTVFTIFLGGFIVTPFYADVNNENS